MIESRGWAHDDDLFGGREIGQSDQASFLILVPRLLPRERSSSAGGDVQCARGSEALSIGGPRRLSRSAQLQALSVSSDDELSDSVCRFRAGFARQAVA